MDEARKGSPHYSDASQNEMESIDISQISSDYCVVCNNLTKLCEQNADELRSQHSETRICDLIQRCLGTRKLHRNIDDKLTWHVRICCDCISKVNDYDLACVTAERAGNELQQMILQTDQIYMDNDMLATEKIETRENPALEVSNYCIKKVEDETTDYCVNLDEVEIFETSTRRTQNEDHGSEDGAYSDAENDLDESTGDECQDVAENPKPKRIYECDSCKATFSLWKELRKHRAAHRNEEAKFRCDICNFDPKNADALAEHKKLHIGLSPLQCVICKKTFTHKRNIRPHMRLHTGQKKYQCDRCGKEYFHKSSFSLHMAYHDGIRTENCPHCPRQFMIKTDLEKHIRTHTGEKPFPCGVCGKRFARRDNMREHQKIHDKQETRKAYTCIYCDASFARPSKLHKHLEKHGVMAISSDVRINNEFTKSDRKSIE